MGLEDNKARVHIELNKDPKTIEEAVQEVIAYIEATSYPKTEDIYYNLKHFLAYLLDFISTNG
jgi:hypothetical protein